MKNLYFMASVFLVSTSISGFSGKIWASEAPVEQQPPSTDTMSATLVETGEAPALDPEPQAASPETVSPTVVPPPPPPQSEESQAQLMVNHLKVLQEIKDRGGYKKEVPTINNIQLSDLLQTPTFQKIYYDLTGTPNLEKKTPDEIVRVVVEGMLQTIKNKIASLKAKDPTYTEGDRIFADMQKDFTKVVEEATALTLKAIREEVTMMKEGYEVFYHAHLPLLRLYYDMLSTIVGYFKIQKMDPLKVLRDKKVIDNEFPDIPTFLQDFSREFATYAASNGMPVLSDADPKFLGFSSGPDHLLWSKINAASVNLSLLGNQSKLGENTFYYFFNAFSHINSLDFLFEALLKKILVGKTDAEIKERVRQYVDLFQKHMERGGGNLLQIFVKSSAVKNMVYLSWPYGIPVWLDGNTKHLAVKDGRPNSPIPMLWVPPEGNIYDTGPQYLLPDPAVSLKLYRSNPEEFVKKFSPANAKLRLQTKKQIFDRQQARLVMDMSSISDPEKIKVDTYTRYQIPKGMEKNYYNKLNQMIDEDMNYFLRGYKGDDESKLGRLQKYILAGEQFKAEAAKEKAQEASAQGSGGE